jgi:hypothetical protein
MFIVFRETSTCSDGVAGPDVLLSESFRDNSLEHFEDIVECSTNGVVFLVNMPRYDIVDPLDEIE